MTVTFEAESALTDRYQATIPETVRQALNLGKRDRIRFTIYPNGEVILSRAEPVEHVDPVLAPFLDFLAQDIGTHPDRLQALDADLVNRIQSLVGSVDVDLDAPLSVDDE